MAKTLRRDRRLTLGEKEISALHLLLMELRHHIEAPYCDWWGCRQHVQEDLAYFEALTNRGRAPFGQEGAVTSDGRIVKLYDSAASLSAAIEAYAAKLAAERLALGNSE